ncbi:hypothetical protein N7470_006681 [Penicillium chermesinum]|nr:hypothetical protein N7470_006681 [Penicillium chermesinum]
MSTGGYENCTRGTFYGFSDNANNEFWPGETVNLQWGAVDNGDRRLNLSLAGWEVKYRMKSSVPRATFTTDSNLYQLVSNTTANCTLEQYTWAIPSDFNTTNPEYQIGLFDGEANLGDNGIPLNGFISWTPAFYVRPKAEATSALKTASATGLVTGTGTALHQPPHGNKRINPFKHAWPHLGIGLGVGLGCAALIALAAFVFFWRRRKDKQAADLAGDEKGGVDGSDTAELSGTSKSIAELQGGAPALGSSTGFAEVKPTVSHEIPGAPPEQKGAVVRTGYDQVHEME